MSNRKTCKKRLIMRIMIGVFFSVPVVSADVICGYASVISAACPAEAQAHAIRAASGIAENRLHRRIAAVTTILTKTEKC